MDPDGLDALAPEVIPGVRVLPVVHDRLDLAAVVRAVLERLEPRAVAVELPPTLESFALQAVRRLPRISLLISQEKAEDALVWVVAPGDPFVEALRWAGERELPTFFVDPDLRYRERHFDPVPDPYAIWTMGAAAYLGTVVESAARRATTATDKARESGMAFYIQEARETLSEGALLALVGAAHFPGVSEKLKGPTAEPLARRRRQSVELRHLHPESLTGLLPDPPLAHAVFETLRKGETPAPPPLEALVSRKVSLSRHGLRLITREKAQDQDQRRRNVVDYAVNQASRDVGYALVPDRLALAATAWRIGSGSYVEQTRESVYAWQRRLFFDFGRRYARAQGLLVPGLYEWVVAARGVADDNLAWEVFDVARTYPWQTEQAEIPLARVEGSWLDLGTRKVRFRRRFFRVKQRFVPVPVRQRRETDDPEKWIRAFNPSICSFPPEDLVVEDYGRFLQQKALALLSAERRRVEPFSTSLLDGIDIRETLLKIHEGRIYVQELGRAPGKAGSVVVVFDQDLGAESKYPYRMTWHGEHNQESDMAFYATDPTEQVVGPGIMRATYGGFMMTMPPGRLFDVWGDADYREAREKAEVLLMAAIDYSLEKIVVQVGKAAPSDRLRQYAARQAKRLVHIPIGSLSVAALKKIRVLHILAGHDKRAIARDYIW